MSKIGKQPIPLPTDVNIQRQDGNITVKGPKGELSRIIPDGIEVKTEENSVIVSLSSIFEMMPINALSELFEITKTSHLIFYK